MEVAAAPNLGRISNRVTIPCSSTSVTATGPDGAAYTIRVTVAVTVTVWLDLVS